MEVHLSHKHSIVRAIASKSENTCLVQNDFVWSNSFWLVQTTLNEPVQNGLDQPKIILYVQNKLDRPNYFGPVEGQGNT